MRFSTLFVSFLFALFTVSLSFGNWPEFRGPTAQGHAEAESLPLSWGPIENVVWKRPVPGEGWSSPAIAGGKIVLTSAVRQGGDVTLYAVALDQETGELAWSEGVFQPLSDEARQTHSKNSLASPTPIIAGGVVYVHFGHMGTAAGPGTQLSKCSSG